jgi:hypothetical protein
MDFIKLNIRVNYMVLEAIRACNRMHDKIHDLVRTDPHGDLDPTLYNLYGLIPLTVVSLKMMCDEVAENMEALHKRSDICVAILQQELRGNHRIEAIWKEINAKTPGKS